MFLLLSICVLMMIRMCLLLKSKKQKQQQSPGIQEGGQGRDLINAAYEGGTFNGFQ